jgi:hypothetical protein
MFNKLFTKKSTVVKRVVEYSYFPIESTQQVELRRNIRERFNRK